MRRITITAAVAALIVAVDQLTKWWALDHLAAGPRHVFWTFRLSLQFNTGIAFSQATGSTNLVIVVELVVVAALIVTAFRARNALTAAVLGLIIGGAAGNLVDRLVRHHHGGVIDFIDPRWFPVFNVADSAVTIGVTLAIVGGLLGGERHRTHAEADEAA